MKMRSVTLEEAKFLINRRNWLIRARKSLQITAAEFADKCGVTLQTYRRFEEGIEENCGELTFDDIYFYLSSHLIAKGHEVPRLKGVNQFEHIFDEITKEIPEET